MIPFTVTPSLQQRFWAKVDRRGPSECWPWTGARTGKGYGQIKINGRKQMTHRVSLAMADGSLKPDGFALHSCDNPRCVNPAHLRWGDHADNMRDKAERGGGAGEAHPASKLSRPQVEQIRSLRGVEAQTTVAAKFGVSASTISLIWSGRTWAEKGVQQ